MNAHLSSGAIPSSRFTFRPQCLAIAATAAVHYSGQKDHSLRAAIATSAVLPPQDAVHTHGVFTMHACQALLEGARKSYTLLMLQPRASIHSVAASHDAYDTIAGGGPTCNAL